MTTADGLIDLTTSFLGGVQCALGGACPAATSTIAAVVSAGASSDEGDPQAQVDADACDDEGDGFAFIDEAADEAGTCVADRQQLQATAEEEELEDGRSFDEEQDQEFDEEDVYYDT